MRDRLILAAVGLLAIALVAFAVPFGIATRGQLVDQALDTLSAEVQQLGRVIDASGSCREVEAALSFLSRRAGRDTAVALLADGGRLVLARDGRDEVVVGPEAAAAFGGAVGKAYREGRLAAAAPLSTRVCNNTLLVLQADRDPTELQSEVRAATVRLGLTAAGVLALGAILAAAGSRRLSQPMEALAASAAALGDGDIAGRAPRSGLEEMDRIADALDVTADRLGRALARSATFAMDASHQLRTPLTALRLHLDALEMAAPDDEALAAAVAAAQAEADRLQLTIDELETLTRTDVPVHAVDLGDVVEQRLSVWHQMARQRGRTITFERHQVPLVAVRGAAIGQAVQVLLDNALVHGRGRVLVRVRPDRTASPSTEGAQVEAVRVEVIDEGSGEGFGSFDETRREGGHGLPLARSLVEAEGGRVTVTSSPATGTCAGIVIPVRGRDATTSDMDA